MRVRVQLRYRAETGEAELNRCGSDGGSAVSDALAEQLRAI
jgi:hypothetical protein